MVFIWRQMNNWAKKQSQLNFTTLFTKEKYNNSNFAPERALSRTTAEAAGRISQGYRVSRFDINDFENEKYVVTFFFICVKNNITCNIFYIENT